MKEVVDFWCAAVILSSNNSVEERYRIKYGHIWNSMYILNTDRNFEVTNDYNHMSIDDLEPTGCVVLNLKFNEFNSAFFQIDPNVNLNLINLRIICEFEDGTYKVKEINSDPKFTISIDKSIYKLKLLFIINKLWIFYQKVKKYLKMNLLIKDLLLEK